MQKLKEINVKKVLKVVLIIAVLGLVAGGVAYYVLSPSEVSVVVCDEGKVSPKLVGIGNVQGDKLMTIYSDVSGKIAKRFVDAGTRVTEGTKLFDYGDELQQQQVDLASTEVSTSQQILSAASASRAKYQSDYDNAVAQDAQCAAEYETIANSIRELDNKKYQGDYLNEKDRQKKEQEIRNLRDRLAEAESNLKDAEYDLQLYSNEEDLIKADIEQVSSLISGSSGSSSDDEDEQRSIEIARALAAGQAQASLNGSLSGAAEDYEDAISDAQNYTDEIYEINSRILELEKEELKIPQEGLKPADYKKYTGYQQQLEDLTKRWTQVKTNMSTAQSMITLGQEIKSDEALVERSKQVLSQAQTELDKAHAGSISPVNGIVTECLVDSGAYVEKGTPIMEMQTDNSYIVKLMVSRFDISNVEEGQKAKLMIGDEEYNGKVTRISQNSVSDASGKPKASIDIAINTDKDLIVGLECDVKIKLNKENHTLRVPTECVYTDDDGSYVYVIDGGKKGTIAKKYIETGVADDNYTQVKDGLSAGDHIVSDPNAVNMVGEMVVEKNP